MGAIDLTHISKSYGNVEVIPDLSLGIGAGEFVVFLGPSGCGKTTLLRIIAGLETVTSGEVWVAGRRVDGLAPGQRGVAMVFQSYALYPHMTIRDNMAFGLRNIGTPKDVIDRRIAETARILEIDHLLDRKPTQLSGGQRQRVAIGRAIVKEPAAFLFDEPLSNLDASLRARTRVELARLHQRMRATMIFVTHDQVEAMTLATSIVVMNKGRIEQIGSPLKVYRRPATRFVASFIGTPAMNFVPVSVAAESEGLSVVRLPDGSLVPTAVPSSLLPGGDFHLGVRPEAMRVDPEGRTRARVEVVEHLGDRTHVYAALSDGTTVILEDAGVSSVRVGDVVPISVASDAAHLFGADGRAYHAA